MFEAPPAIMPGDHCENRTEAERIFAQQPAGTVVEAQPREEEKEIMKGLPKSVFNEFQNAAIDLPDTQPQGQLLQQSLQQQQSQTSLGHAEPLVPAAHAISPIVIGAQTANPRSTLY